MSKTSYPPTTLHRRAMRLPPAIAEKNLTTYLDQTTTSPHLHPDALLQPGGITYSSSGAGPSGGLVLHQLRRIAAGLRGEILAPDPETETEMGMGMDAETQTGMGTGMPRSDDRRLDAEGRRVRKRGAGNELGPDGTPRKSAMKRRRVGGEEGEVEARAAGVDSEGEVLRDGVFEGEGWERAQEIVEGEVGERDGAAAVDVGRSEPEPRVVGRLDKEARKAEKKARAKTTRREKEERRAAG